MKPRSAIVAIVACLMAVSQPVHAASRSGNALPAKGVEAAQVSRGSEEAEGANDFFNPLWIAFILALIGGMAAVITSDSGNNDRPG